MTTVEPTPSPTSVDGNPLTARGAATRARLLGAAEVIFAEYGWEQASIVKITERALVSQGTFYRYWESKQAIFDDLVDDLNRRVRWAMAEGAARGANREEAERYGFEGFFRFTAEHPALYRVIRQAEFASPAALHRHYEKIAEGYVEALRSAMERGEVAAADPELIAYALMGIGELVGMRWILWSGANVVPDDLVDQLMGFISRGLGIRR